MVLSLRPHRALGAQFHLERGCAVIHQIIVVVTETGWRAALGCVGRIGIGGGHLLLPVSGERDRSPVTSTARGRSVVLRRRSEFVSGPTSYFYPADRRFTGRVKLSLQSPKAVPNSFELRVSESMFTIAQKTGGQCESDVRSWYGRLHRRMTRNIVCICGGLRSGAEYDIFTSVDLIDRRHSLDGSVYLRLPQDSARCRIQGSNLAVARARENHAARG